ncbi:RagB/SusD family nutrient uptake outer membrane protein [Neptunitalea lumnitzerae]|nr:RagB/SusD family nutrient uptake outer membrane protein [Neptunitalea sp. Y10]
MRLVKSIKYIGVLGLVCVSPFLTTSCSDDFLEEKRDLTGFNEEVFSDSLLAKGFIDGMYAAFQPGDNSQSMIWDLPVNGDDFVQTSEELAGETNWNKVWASITNNQNNCLQYFGERITSSRRNNVWTRMKQINIFLNNIDGYGLPEETRNRFKGQLYFWRAYQYFDLLRLYGGVPIVLEAQNPIVDGDGLAVPRSSSEETLNQIIDDLDTAMELLPGKWGSNDWGRITSGAAAAFKGRVLLTWASPLFNRNDDAGRWEQAYQANLEAKSILESNGFGLYTNGGFADAAAWGNMWFDEVNNPEAVITYGFNNATSDQVQRNNGWERACRSKEINGGGSISPTKQVVEAFPMKDGKMPGESSYTYDDQKFYKNRDPRFYKTFVYNGGVWPYGGNQDYRQWTYRWYGDASNATPNRTTETLGANGSGIYLRKATDPGASNADGYNFSGTDYMELRFAEVILNLAESAIGANHLDEGLSGITAIRERAGVENLNGYYGLDAGMSRDELFAAVLHERQVEFAYEGKRFWDLRRWMLFDDTYGTVSRLGVTPLNNTRRTGYYIVVKDSGNNYIGDEDPLLPNENLVTPLIDRNPDSYPAGITTYDEYVDYLYDNYFEVIEKDDLDPTNGNWTFTWYEEYYFFGIHQNILDASPYLEQTVGWGGSFDPLD